MPYGVFPVPKRPDSTNRGPSRLGVGLRVRTRLERAALDGELANGADPNGSDELALRAYQLRSLAERARIANGLVEAVGEARRGTPMNLRVRPQREAVRTAADEIQWVVLRLRDEHPVGLAGVAKAARLVDDRRGPLYRDNAGDLGEAIASARAALEPTRRVVSEPAAWAA
jgi:hypothetical protein